MSAILNIPIVAYGQSISGIVIPIGSTVNYNVTCEDPNTRDPLNITGGNVVMSLCALDIQNNPKQPPLISRQGTITDAPNGAVTIPWVAGDTAPTPSTAFAANVYGFDLWLTDVDGNRLQCLAFGFITLVASAGLPGNPITPLPEQEPLAQGPAGAAGAPGPAGLSYATFSLLRAGTPPPNNTLIPIAGHSTAGDGGGGLFLYDTSSTTTDDDALTLKYTSVGGGAGRALRQYDGRRYNVKFWGAKVDGTTDDSTAVNAAVAFTQTLTPKGGTIYIPGNCVIASQINAHGTKGVRLLGDGSQVFTSRLAGDRPTSSLIFTTNGTGLPTNNLGLAALVDARSTDGFQMIGLGVLQSSLTYPGIGLDYSHDSSGSDSGQGYVADCAFSGISFDGVNYQAPAAAAISYAGAIECRVERTSFYRWQAAIRGQEQIGNSLAYSNVIEARNCQFAQTVDCFVNPGQSWRIIDNTAEGLGSATLYCKHFIRDDIDDTTSGYSHDLLTVEGNWCGDAFGQQEWIKIRPTANASIRNNLLEGSSLGCIEWFSSNSSPVCQSVMLQGNDYSPTSSFWVNFGSGFIWKGLQIFDSLDLSTGNVLNLPNKTGVIFFGAQIAFAAQRPTIEGVSFSPAIAPDQLANLGGALKSWWKADALALNDGDLVSSFTDSSGHSFPLSASGAGRPTYKTNIQAGLPIVRFDGVNNFMTSPDMSLTTPCALLIVCRFTGSLVSQDTFVDGNLGVNQARIYRSGIYQMNLGGVTLETFSTHYGVYLVAVTAGNANGIARAGDLSAAGTMANFATFIHSLVVGRDGAGLHPAAVDLAEFATFDRIPYPDEAVGLMQWQRTKWQAF